MKADVTLVMEASRGDWEALYINGEKVADGHTLYHRDILSALEGVEVGETRVESYPIDAMGDNPWGKSMRFPVNLSEIPLGDGE